MPELGSELRPRLRCLGDQGARLVSEPQLLRCAMGAGTQGTEDERDRVEHPAPCVHAWGCCAGGRGRDVTRVWLSGSWGVLNACLNHAHSPGKWTVTTHTQQVVPGWTKLAGAMAWWSVPSQAVGSTPSPCCCHPAHPRAGRGGLLLWRGEEQPCLRSLHLEGQLLFCSGRGSVGHL